MVVAITATEQAAYPPRVLVSVTGLTLGDAITLYRSVNGFRTEVRAGYDLAVTDTSFLRIDAELPFGVPVTYLALVNGENYVFGTTRYTFDSTSEGWAGEGATSVTRVTSPTHDGAGSLRATKTMSAGLDSLRFNDAGGLPDDISAGGPSVGVWALVPSGAAGSDWVAHIEVQDSTFTWQAGANSGLTPGTWTLLTYSPPPGLLADCRAVGVQFEATGVNGSQSVYIDTVVQGTSPIQTEPVTYELPGGKVAVSDAITGNAAEVEILNYGQPARNAGATILRTGGRNIVVSRGFAGFSTTLDLVTHSPEQRDNLIALLQAATEGTIQIRQPGGYEQIDAYVNITSHEMRWLVPSRSQSPRRGWALDAVEVEPWAPVLEARGFTLQDIADAYTGLTLDDLSDDYATLLAIAQADWS